MDAEDPLFILYTSGSTGKPKGVLHTSGGYLVYASMTHELVFDLREDDIFWCTADVGWVTGHSYVVYGPLANGATTVMFEGVPNYPDSGRFWQTVDKHKVTLFYTAPTAIRALMREGEEPVKEWSRSSLRLLGSVGEPINPEAWEWYHRVVGDGRCPVVDTWWQTETGGVLISPLPGAIDQKPGSATLPFFGVKPAIVDNEGNTLEGACEGNLVLSDSWPGQMRTVFGDHQRFIDTYFKTFPGRYFTGDGARRDEDGYYWITGRVDDVLNVAGHRLGTAEIESAMVAHPSVAEAAAVGYPHDIKGQGIYVYVTLIAGVEPTEALRTELRDWVRKEISPIATPDLIQWAPSLPKTRSGKIMRRILRKIAANEHDQLGDISTLADPAVVENLVRERMNRPAAEIAQAAADAQPAAKAPAKKRKKKANAWSREEVLQGRERGVSAAARVAHRCDGRCHGAADVAHSVGTLVATTHRRRMVGSYVLPAASKRGTFFQQRHRDVQASRTRQRSDGGCAVPEGHRTHQPPRATTRHLTHQLKQPPGVPRVANVSSESPGKLKTTGQPQPSAADRNHHRASATQQADRSAGRARSALRRCRSRREKSRPLIRKNSKSPGSR